MKLTKVPVRKFFLCLLMSNLLYSLREFPPFLSSAKKKKRKGLGFTVHGTLNKGQGCILTKAKTYRCLEVVNVNNKGTEIKESIKVWKRNNLKISDNVKLLQFSVCHCFQTMQMLDSVYCNGTCKIQFSFLFLFFSLEYLLHLSWLYLNRMTQSYFILA